MGPVFLSLTVALRVEEEIGGIVSDAKILLDSGLLSIGQIVVDAVLTRQFVFADDAAPGFVARIIA